MTGDLLRLAGIGRRYPGPPPVDALRDVDLRVTRNDFVAVVGASGSGKSTLLNVLGLLDVPTGGRYLVDGRDVTTLRRGEGDRLRSRTFGFVFQSAHVLGARTVAANVALPLQIQRVDAAARPAMVAQALDTVGMLHRAQARGGDLSGGERQRVAIARALVARPAVLLADEPTGNLDTATATRVLDVLRFLHREHGLTIVMITHNLDVTHLADRVVHLADGRLTE